MMKTRQMDSLLALGAVLAMSCSQSKGPDAGFDSATSPSTLLKKLDGLNHCSSDADCWDHGFVPTLGCHVPIAGRLGAGAEAQAIVDADAEVKKAREACAFERGDATAPGCRIECPPFFGFECQAGKCIARSTKPDRDICYVNGALKDCGYVLDSLSHSRWFDCRRICDGGHEGGARMQVIVDGETKDFAPFSETLVIDFIRCASCR